MPLVDVFFCYPDGAVAHLAAGQNLFLSSTLVAIATFGEK